MKGSVRAADNLETSRWKYPRRAHWLANRSGNAARGFVSPLPQIASGTRWPLACDWVRERSLWLSEMAVERQGPNRYFGGEMIIRSQQKEGNWMARVKDKIENRCCVRSKWSSVASDVVSRFPMGRWR